MSVLIPTRWTFATIAVLATITACTSPTDPTPAGSVSTDPIGSIAVNCPIMSPAGESPQKVPCPR